jgi:predicted nucleic acid-binding protein
MLVVDAGAVVNLLIRTRAGQSVAEHLSEHDPAAPHIFDLEALHALRRLGASGRLTRDQMDTAVLDLLDLPVERVPHGALLPRIWFLRDDFTSYEASYLALAEVLADDGVPLLTADARFARAARKHSDVEVLLAA